MFQATFKVNSIYTDYILTIPRNQISIRMDPVKSRVNVYRSKGMQKRKKKRKKKERKEGKKQKRKQKRKKKRKKKEKKSKENIYQGIME